MSNVHYFKSLKRLAILSELVMTDFCICRAIVSFLSPTCSLSAFLSSLEYPRSTSTIIMNCVTLYLGYLCLSSHSITGTFLFSLFTMVASILFSFTCVLSAYRGMSQCAITLSFSYIGLGWVFENHGTSDVTRSSTLIT